VNILSIDTSSAIMSLALQTEKGLYQYTQEAGLTHSEDLLPRIKDLTQQGGTTLKDLDLVVVASGPGSFTGLRIAMATAKGIAQGAQAELVSIPTLDIYGRILSFLPAPLLVAVDAKKKQFFAAYYQGGQKISPYFDASPEEILQSGPEISIVSGPEGDLFLDRLGKTGQLSFAKVTNTALHLMEMGVEKWKKQGADPDDSAPVYLRKSEAEIHREKMLKENER